ncbi:MAG: S8 family serine peptidase [Candidatus Marinimicrobia bacterium]|nr:S8 family serine peptidase [Candidatus Neomarinimicrobiota bacterium]
MRYVALFIMIQSMVFCKKFDLQEMELGKRGDSYRVWIYFTDKNGSLPVEISQKAMNRRAKNGTTENNLWYDLPVPQGYVDRISSVGITIINESRWLNAVSAVCSISDLDRIVTFPFIDHIKPVIGYRKNSDIEFPDISPYSRDFDYGNAQEQIEQINVHELHEQGYTGEGVRILLLDTGFDLNHDALNQINVIAQWDVINDDDETANETDEEDAEGQDYHGTAVLSTIAANAPGELVGVAFDSEFLLAKTEDVTQEVQQEEDNYVAALEWGEENGADVVSTSLGYLDWYEYSDMDGNTAVTTIGVDIAVGLGMVCVTAAGNSGNDDWYYIIAPADADSVISVGAVWDNGSIASFSSHGPTSDGRIKPEVCARGRQTWCVNPNSTTNYSQLSGTSLACPLVGGAAALIIQARPEWTAIQVREAMMMTASMADSANNTYGHGILNAVNAVNYEATANLDDSDFQPKDFQLIRAYPNPFNPSINIEIEIGSPYGLKIDVLSYDGSYIANIYDDWASDKLQQLKWEPNDLSSGIYFIRAVYNGNFLYKKVTYIK